MYRNSLDELNKKIEENEEITKLYKESLLKIDSLQQKNQIKDKEGSSQLYRTLGSLDYCPTCERKYQKKSACKKIAITGMLYDIMDFNSNL